MPISEWDVVKAFTLGPLLEASIPKPGNVNRYRDFEDLTLYHFLFGAISPADTLFEAARTGQLIRMGKLGKRDVRIGRLIREAIHSSISYQGSNANFGILVLEIPLAVACVATQDLARAGDMASLLVGESSPEDSIELYKAIREANPRGLKRGVKYDVYNEDVYEELRADDVNLRRVAELGCREELIYCEWIRGYSLTISTFERLRELTSKLSLEEAVITAFLELLASNIDTLIARKAGREEAELVRERASDVLEGSMSLEEYDNFLREKGNLRNPGSLADIMAVSLSLLILDGYRLS